MKRAILFLLFATLALHAEDVFFRAPYTIWQNADIVLWTPDSVPPVTPTALSFALRKNNSDIGRPTCRLGGDWQRDTSAALYANWLGENIGPGLQANDLRARSPEMIKKLAGIEDKMILFLTRHNDTLYTILFEGDAAQPKMAGSLPFIEDTTLMSEALADMYFSGRTARRLTADERKAEATKPDELYQKVPDFHWWAGVGVGHTQAQIPFTPYSWYKHKLRSRVKHYRATDDSLSLWNFLEDKEPLFTVYAGGTWYGFIGAELFLRYSQHDMKLDKSDTLYKELDYWYFNRYEIGLNIHLSRLYHTTTFMDISPYAFIGFNYSFFSENIDTKSGVKEPSDDYKTRISFENFYKGALIGGGTRFIFLKHYGIDLRAGIVSRGRMLDTDPDPDAVAEPTKIGGSTYDCFATFGLEYHWGL